MYVVFISNGIQHVSYRRWSTAIDIGIIIIIITTIFTHSLSSSMKCACVCVCVCIYVILRVPWHILVSTPPRRRHLLLLFILPFSFKNTPVWFAPLVAFSNVPHVIESAYPTNDATTIPFGHNGSHFPLSLSPFSHVWEKNDDGGGSHPSFVFSLTFTLLVPLPFSLLSCLSFGSTWTATTPSFHYYPLCRH